ncbi:hypothetical protein BDF19DRAFT_487855 [Syncephalis fuscata]|nr:hypothetical protein BDF19DRAFT_487855 [Syncephalis fuscata]
MLNSIGTFILLSWFIVSAFDLFEAEVAPYTTRGVLVDAAFNKNALCEVLPSVLDTAQSALDSVKSDNITAVIIAIDSVKALRCGCATIAHAGIAVSKLNQYLNDTNSFSIDTALYILHTKLDPGFGAYPILLYTVLGLSFYEVTSPINIALLPHNNYQIAIDLSDKLETTVIVTVKEEPGPWNNALLSTDYQAFIYCTLAVLISIILYSFVILYSLIKEKRTITKYQAVIYVFALCAAILCALEFPLRLRSSAYKCITFFQRIFAFVGFYLLLLLWHLIAVSVRSSRYLQLLRYVIIVSFLITAIERIVYASSAFTQPSIVQSTVQNVCNYFTLATLMIIAIPFTYYGITFWLKQGNLLANSTARHALSLVTKICAVFSFGHLLVFIVNIMKYEKVWHYSVEAEVARIAFYKLSSVVRIGPLLFIIGLRPKSDGQRKDKKAVKANSKNSAATLVQSTYNRHIPFVGAIISSNIDPNVQPTTEDGTDHNTTTAYV